MSELLLATGNPGKIRELQALLQALPLTLHTPSGLGLDLPVAETGATYAENARLKALAYAHASGHWALADDTGLEVAALGGEPGLHSARMAGPQGTDADRRQKLLQRLQAKPQPWRARFYCVVALANPDGAVVLAEGSCPGEIIPLPRGEHGFGYDPIFQVKGTQQTMAELEMDAKNRLSHRARAVQALIPALRRALELELD